MNAEFRAKCARIADGVRTEIEQFRKFGGPTPHDLAMVCTFSHTFAFGERSELAVLPERELNEDDRKEKARMEAMEIRAIAVLSYLPGGVTLYGQHWDAAHEK